MKIALFLGFAVVTLYLVKRWQDCSAENTHLRNQVESLKRQLRQVTRTTGTSRTPAA